MHVVDSLTAPLPFPEADRIVGIRNRNIAENRAEVRGRVRGADPGLGIVLALRA